MFKKIALGFGVVALAIFLSACSKPPVTIDQAQAASLAQWLTDSGVKMYGAFWCPHCADQKAMFGDAFKKINYIECSTPDKSGQLQVCKDAKIESYPTWEFKDGSRIEGVLSFDQLKQKSGYPETNGTTGPPTAPNS